MNPRLRKALDWTFGITLIGIGLILLVFPGPGLVLIVAGLAILSSHSPWARAIYERIKLAGRTVRDKLMTKKE